MRIAHVILYLALLCTMCTVYIQICFNLMQSYLYVWPQGTLTYCMNAIFSWCDSQGQSFNYTKKNLGSSLSLKHIHRSIVKVYLQFICITISKGHCPFIALSERLKRPVYVLSMVRSKLWTRLRCTHAWWAQSTDHLPTHLKLQCGDLDTKNVNIC